MSKLCIPLALDGCALASPALASNPQAAAIAQLQDGPSAGTHRLALVAGHLRPDSVYTISAAVAGAPPARCAASLRARARSDARGDLRVFTFYRADWCAGATYAGPSRGLAQLPSALLARRPRPASRRSGSSSRAACAVRRDRCPTSQ